jgi:hypothetical protein
MLAGAYLVVPWRSANALHDGGLQFRGVEHGGFGGRVNHELHNLRIRDVVSSHPGTWNLIIIVNQDNHLIERQKQDPTEFDTMRTSSIAAFALVAAYRHVI